MGTKNIRVGFANFLVFQVFHKIITTGHQRLQPLFDCLLTIIVNGKNDKILGLLVVRFVFACASGCSTAVGVDYFT